jgi:hypothetical protein
MQRSEVAPRGTPFPTTAMLTPMLLLALAPSAQDDPSLALSLPQRPSQAVTFDDGARPAPTPPLGTIAPLAPETAAGLVAARNLETEAKGAAPEPTLRAPLSIRERLTAPLVDEPGDGRVWVRGRDYRASFGAEGATFLPVFGRAAERELPVVFALESVRRGGDALPTGVESVAHDGGSVTLEHPALREVYHLSLDGIEQTFVFDELDGAGDLVVDVAVETELTALDAADGLHFVHATLGHVTYGDAFVLDAKGQRLALPREWTGEGIRLTVPAEFLASAVLPLTIDPPVTAWVNTFGTHDDFLPDLCFDGRRNQYWVAWQEYTSSVNRDVYVTTFSPLGNQGTSFAVDITSDDWTWPRIAYHYGADRLLVVASEMAGSQGSIRGRLVDALARTTLGAEIAISSLGARKLHPDVGGNNAESLPGAYFCVVWAFQVAPDDHNVQYRVIDWDGSFVTNITEVDGTTDDTLQTAISESHGDSTLNGDYWTMVWTRDVDGDGLGAIEARRILWSGSTNNAPSTFTVDGSTNCSWPTVSSRLDDIVTPVQDRPSIVVYEREFASASAPGGRQRSLYGRVVVNGVSYGASAISETMEDVNGELDQRDPHIATDGNAWYLVYSEIYHGNPGGYDRDVYYCSGHVSRTPSSAYLALAERHETLGYSGTVERYPRVATAFDGEYSTVSDDAAAVWIDLTGTSGGTLEGSTLEIPTSDQSTWIAVGRQFCDANPNGGPSVHGARSSWMWLEGDQTLGAHRAYCENVTPNATGYLLASRTATNVNQAGGGAGRLCVSGAGRYVNAVQNSGAARTYSTSILPTALPTPTGVVSAAAGETWYFQYWHRDTQSGLATSNFSNACSVTFVP